MDDPIEQEFAEYIEKISLSQEDKHFWFEMIKKAAPEVAFSILSYFQEFPDKIQWATDMLKRKVEAMKTKNKQAWAQILAEEEREITQFINSQPA